MVIHGPSGVPSQTRDRLGDEFERSKRLHITALNAKAYQRRVAANRGLWGRAAFDASPRAASDRGSSCGCEPAASERGSSGGR
jgi:hypothetical protein